jgi:hypothetical protein
MHIQIQSVINYKLDILVVKTIINKICVTSLVKIPFVSREKAETLIAKAKLSISSSHDKTTETIIKAAVGLLLEIGCAYSFVHPNLKTQNSHFQNDFIFLYHE